MIEAIWLGAMAAFPLSVVVLARTGVDVERLRWLAVSAATLSLVLALLPLGVPALGALRISWGGATHGLLGASVVRMDGLSAVLLPLTAALWLFTIAVTPRARLDRRGLARTALGTLATLAAFLTTSPVLLLVLWILSAWTLFDAHAEAAHRRARRIVAGYVGFGTVMFAAGIVAEHLLQLRGLGLWLIATGAMVRKGIFPFHAWIPEVFDRGRLGPTLLFSAPQLGAYVTLVLVVPYASATLLRVVAMLALGTAVYAAALAVYQRDARRAAGYLFVSQSALVMAGLDCSSVEALAGALVMWVSSALGFAGLGRVILALEARRGRLDLSRHHGGYEQMPLLAVSFLVMGLACMGFPGTLGFIGQEMLVDGAVTAFPVLGLCVIAAAALTGIAVLRMYFSLFCGRRDTATALEVLPREKLGFGITAAVLIGLGIAPAPLVASRLAVADAVLALRSEPQHEARVLDRPRIPSPASARLPTEDP